MTFVLLQFRPVGEVCYSWARQPQRDVDSLVSCTHSVMWDAASSYCNQLSVPYEVRNGVRQVVELGYQ
jgi:hypothetical protein